MNYQQTSAMAYAMVVPELGHRQQIVYNEIRQHDNVTNTELSQILKIPINAITPRCKELRDKGLVEEDCKRHCQVTNKVVIAWRKKRTTLFD